MTSPSFRLLSVACFASLSIGCASVSSLSSGREIEPRDDSQDGLAYYLPMRYVEAVFRREEIDIKALNEKHAAATTAQRAAEATMAASESAMKQAKARTEALLKSGMSVSAEKYHEALIAEIDTALAYTNAAGTAARASRARDDATTALMSARAADSQCGYVDSFTFTPQKLVADTEAKYALRMEHSWFRNDAWTFKTTTQGLLSTVDSVNDDQTAQILVALAQARAAQSSPLSFTMNEGGPWPSPMHQPAPNGQRKPTPCDFDWKPLVVRTLIDPSDAREIKAFMDDVSKASAVNCKETICGSGIIDIQYDYACHGCIESEPAKTTSSGSNGVFYRRELPLSISVKRRDNMESLLQGKQSSPSPQRTVGLFQLVLPNASPAEHLPLKAGSFVRTHHALEFDQGMLIAVKSERPSEALRIASTPWEIAKATMGVVGEIVKFKVDYTSQDEALIEQQTRQLEQLRLQLEAQRELDGAREEDAL